MSDVAKLMEANRALADELDRLNAGKKVVVRDEHGIVGTTVGNAVLEGAEVEDQGESVLGEHFMHREPKTAKHHK